MNKARCRQVLTILVNKGWTYAALGRALDERRETIARWHSGEYPIRHPKITALALETLMDLEPPPKRLSAAK